MKNIFILAAAAAFVLSSCSNEEIVKAPEAQEDGAVAFGAYAGRNTRADAIGDVKGLADAGGFGVFAYEQGTTAWATYRASNTYPNFMYNQNVTSSDDGATWTYAPVKYFSNNLNAKHSFFAYAPYKANPSVVFSKTNQGPAIRYNGSTDDYDLMWGANTTTAWYDLGKLGVTDKITFNFKHALAKVGFKVTYFVDDVHGTGHTEGTDKLADGTEILVRSVKFIGNVPSQGILDLYDGKWTIETTEESAYEIVPANPISFTSNDNANTYKDVKSDMMVIPTLSGSDVKIQVVYDVITTDKDNPKNSSVVTNVIESEDAYPLIAGTAYTFKLDLGLTSVKFAATTADWNATSNHNVDLPNNYSYSLLSVTNLTTDQVGNTAGAATALSAMPFYLDTQAGQYLVLGTGTTDPVQDTSVSGNFYDATNKKLYVVTAGVVADPVDVKTEINGSPATLEALKTAASGYYEVNDKVYKVK